MSLACALPGGAANTPGGPTAEGAASGSCEEGARLVQANRLYREELPASTGPYPSNCIYYCIWVREPAGDLTIDIRDASADLDLFVGLGSIEAVSGEQLVEGETFMWKSNQPGNVDERVEISPAEAGMYYLEVCSYEGESTPFELEARLR
jgi:hypothetical protein